MRLEADTEAGADRKHQRMCAAVGGQGVVIRGDAPHELRLHIEAETLCEIHLDAAGAEQRKLEPVLRDLHSAEGGAHAKLALGKYKIKLSFFS